MEGLDERDSMWTDEFVGIPIQWGGIVSSVNTDAAVDSGETPSVKMQPGNAHENWGHFFSPEMTF